MKIVFVLAALVFIILVIANAYIPLLSFGKIARKQGWLAGMSAAGSAAQAARRQKGFTLIELLVVIGIIVVLSVVVFLTLNPAELLKQARDSNRISDLGAIRNAVLIFMADTASSSIGVAATCYESKANPTSSCASWFTSTTDASATASRSVDGTGWIPINFKAISSGAPIGSLPIDPLNTSANFYSYTTNPVSLTFKLGAFMESARYRNGGQSDVESTDGGSSNTVYEIGTDLNL